MKISIKGYIVGKKSELYADCADRYAYNKKNNKFAISDGVSKSFFPKIWAELLVNNFVNEKEINEEALIKKSQKEWFEKVTKIVNNPNVKWFTQNAYNSKTPGLATFVSLEFNKDEWKAEALGDSFLFFVPKKIKDFDKDCIALSSKDGNLKDKNIIFDNFPDYYTSIGEKHNGIKKSENGKIQEGFFFLMTDALSEWFINEKENAVKEIKKWKTQEDYIKFIETERDSEKLGNDDSAILIIEIIKLKGDKIKYEKENVSDIDELIKQENVELEKKKKEQEKEAKKKEEEHKKKTELEEKEKQSNKENNTEDSTKEETILEKENNKISITKESENVVIENKPKDNKTEDKDKERKRDIDNKEKSNENTSESKSENNTKKEDDDSKMGNKNILTKGVEEGKKLIEKGLEKGKETVETVKETFENIIQKPDNKEKKNTSSPNSKNITDKF